MGNFKRLNVLIGWLIFIIASAVYLLTIEASASFWDCGEFILTAFRQEVGHPPGNPTFLMLARLFTIFNPAKAAVMVNVMSAFCSSFTILFLFWTITHLMRKMIGKKVQDLALSDTILILGAGAVGALCYTFTDSFWFNAVEGEVYAMSSLFTALVFWVILKWEDEADERYANRWLILAAYLMGISIGVHLLNLLAIPAMVMVYYFKKYDVSVKGILYASLVAVIILAVSLYGIIPWTFKIGSWFELLFVNKIGMGYNTGLLIYVVLLLVLAVFGVYYTFVKGKVLAFYIVTCTALMLLGYGTYAMVLIRSNANPPMNQGGPNNVFNLMNYINRDQYGDRPLFMGQYYNAPVLETKVGEDKYAAINGKYEVVDQTLEYVYDDRFTTFFPRMWSNQGEHVNFYQSWLENSSGKSVVIENNRGEQERVVIPSFGDNMKFFFGYQLNWMYFRYFMWNFAGRQNDLQGQGDESKGNWISGISFIDNLRLGDQSKLPKGLSENKGRNVYYMLPFLLGLMGMFIQYNKNGKDFSVVMLLFFFTGIAIVIYLNQTPLQPRERDYSYAGSFYAFAIWVGLGVAMVAQLLRKLFKNETLAASIASAACLLVPMQMAAQNWNDHDRSRRWLAHDFAYNYVNSCDKNAILFTYGDNDTFPLWYIQEVEGVRDDIRVMNLSYAGADWYIPQMKRKAYQSDAVPMFTTYEKIVGNRRQVIYVQDRINEPVDLRQAVDFVLSDNPATKISANSGESYSFFPSKTLQININKDKIVRNGYLKPEDAGKINDKISINLNQSYLFRNSFMILDVIAAADWDRPVYFGITVPGEYYMGLTDNFACEGLACKLVPFQGKIKDSMYGYLNTAKMYDNLVNKFLYTNLKDQKAYFDETCDRMIGTYRNQFTRLTGALMQEGDTVKAIKVLKKMDEVLPLPAFQGGYFMVNSIDYAYTLGLKSLADKWMNYVMERTGEELIYFMRLDRNKNIRNPQDFSYETSISYQTMANLREIAQRHKLDEKAKKAEAFLKNL